MPVRLFDIVTPPVDQIPVEPILQLQPETVFLIAMKNQPAQKANALRLQSFEAAAAKRTGRPCIRPFHWVVRWVPIFPAPIEKLPALSLMGFKEQRGFGTVPVAVRQYKLCRAIRPKYRLTRLKNRLANDGMDGVSKSNNNFRQSFGFI